MAERNHLRIADHNDLPNDDPFAELTRIMGFDPRQPVRQQPVETAADEDDFGIDLEKELLGELAADDPSEAATAISASEFASEPIAYDSAREPAAEEGEAEEGAVHLDEAAFETAAFEDELTASLQADDEPAYDGLSEPAAEAEEGAVHPDEAVFETAAFEDELAASLQANDEPAYDGLSEPAAEAEEGAVHLDEVAFETAAFEDELAASLQADDEPVVPAGQDADAVSEDQLAAAFEEEFSLADDFAEDSSHEAVAQTETADDLVGDAVAVDDRAFEPDFETAPAADAPDSDAQSFEEAADADDFVFEDALHEELARDFAEAPPSQPVVAAEPANGAYAAADEGLELPGDENWEPADEYDAPVAAEEFSGQPAAETAAAPGDDFDAALPELDMDFSAPAAAVAADNTAEGDLDDEPHLQLSAADHYDYDDAVAQEQEADAPEPDELSLEDELNALLGNTPGRHGPIADAVAVESPSVETPPAEENAEDALLDDLADDLDAVNWAFEASEPTEAQDASASTDDFSAGETTPADDAGERWQEDEQPAYAVGAAEDEADFASGPAADFDGDLDLEFDDEAFDAAISNGIAGGAQTVHATEHGAASERQDPEHPVVKESDDPYAALAALTASMRSVAPAASWRQEAAPAPVEAYQQEAPQDNHGDPSASYEDFPDIETVEVPEHAVALADDLDIPELAVEEKLPQPTVYDDIDTEFVSLLNEMNSPEKTAAPAPAYQAEDDYATEFERAFASQEMAHPISSHAGPAAFAAGLAGGTAFAGASTAAFGSAIGSGDDEYLPGSRKPEAQLAGEEFAYDPDLDEEMASPEYAAARQQPQRRGMFVAAIVGGVAVLGGLGAFAMSFGEAGSDAPVVVKADAEPVKVRPENPGGTTVPNQDKAVYETVAGTGGEEGPRQEKLLTSAEEPIEVPKPEPEPEPRMAEAAPAAPAPVDAAPVDTAPVEQAAAPQGDLPQALPAADQPPALPQAKSEDRIEQVIQEASIDNNVEVAAVAPRKVRTMIVKADGTLVPREDPKPVAAAPTAAPASAPAADTSTAEPAPSAPDATGTVPPADATPNAAAAAPATDTPQIAAEPAPAGETSASATPSSVPVAPARPSDQPVEIVGEVKADQVAALNPPSGANGAWSMQIASQPSEAAAQSSYQDLLRRYGSVLEGRQANIVKAEIAGKGTFWRVRVPAGSRDEAIKLCESYKSAGGNCFVSK
jgi:hypothetical protein